MNRSGRRRTGAGMPPGPALPAVPVPAILERLTPLKKNRTMRFLSILLLVLCLGIAAEPASAAMSREQAVRVVKQRRAHPLGGNGAPGRPDTASRY